MLNPDFKELLRSFNAKNIEYLVVGGYALAAHGCPRYTGVIDPWLWTGPENARLVHQALVEFGFGTSGLSEADFIVPDQVI